MIGHFASRLTNKAIEDLFESIYWNYSPWPHIYDTDANRDQIVKMVTDYQIVKMISFDSNK